MYFLVPEDLFSRSISARLGTVSTPLQIRNDYVALGQSLTLSMSRIHMPTCSSRLAVAAPCCLAHLLALLLVATGSGTHGRVDFTVIAHEDGPVRLSATVSHDPAPTAETNNAWVISFDDDQPHEWHADQLTEAMNRLSIDKTFQLDAGRHTLHLDIRQPRARLQSFTITSGHVSFIGAYMGSLALAMMQV